MATPKKDHLLESSYCPPHKELTMYPIRPSMLTRFYQFIGKSMVLTGLAYGSYQLITDKTKRKQIGDTIEHAVDDPKQAVKDAHVVLKRGVRQGREILGNAIDKAESNHNAPNKNTGDSWKFFSWLHGSKSNSAKPLSDNDKKPPRL